MIKAIITNFLLLSLSIICFSQDTAKKESFAVRYIRQLNFDSGMAAPNFSCKDIKGKTITRSDFKGKIVALYFWSSECENSVDNMADCVSKTAAIFKQLYPGEIVFINVGEEMKKRKWKTMVKKYSPEDYNIYSFALNREISKLYECNSMPKLILIGRDGIIMGAPDTNYVHLLSLYLRCAIKGMTPAYTFRTMAVDPNIMKEHNQWFFANKLDKYQELKPLSAYEK